MNLIQFIIIRRINEHEFISDRQIANQMFLFFLLENFISYKNRVKKQQLNDKNNILSPFTKQTFFHFVIGKKNIKFATILDNKTEHITWELNIK